MRITAIEVYHVRYGLKDKKYAWSGGHSVTSFLSNIVKVCTDEGIHGYGEVCPLGSGYMDAYAAGVAEGVRELGPTVIGRDPTCLRALNDAMDAALGGHHYVKSPIDIACWDITGKAAGVPVATLLGGRVAESVHLYRAISQASPREMADSVARYHAEGYRRFQLKVGANPDDDVARIRAVKGVLGPGDVLVADANTGWRPHEAIRLVNAVAHDDVYIEQPCPTLEECLVVREHTTLPMVLDEVITGVVPFLRAWQSRAMDAVNIKISRVGGLTKARQIRDLCEALGVVMTIEDSWGGDVTTAAIAHLAGSTRPEFLFTSTDFNSYVDVEVSPDAPRRHEGRLPVPAGAGLGMTVDDAKLGEPVVRVGKG